ncbi:MAG: helix-turn-helix domain-containing protein [Bacteroidota bacterium]
MSTANNWLGELNRVIDQRIDDPNLDNLELARSLSMSERQFIRKVKALTELTPQKYVRRYRLQTARYYLENGIHKTVKGAAAAVSYRSVSYFIAQFELEFNVRPLHILKKYGWR